VGEAHEEARLHTGSELGRAVYNDARRALSSGKQEDEIIQMLTDFYLLLGTEGRKDEQDAIADVLDFLHGFCSPTAAL